jgi:hypothetical protein
LSDSTVKFSDKSALKQTVFVLERNLAGKSNAEIVALFENDERLVYACTAFLKELKWLKQSNAEAVSSDVTNSGKASIEKYDN